MGLNKQKGNMYDFVTDTWNPIRGDCEHKCTYCSIDNPGYGPRGPLRLVQKELFTKIGKDKFVFVGSSTDMWASNVERDNILSVMAVCDIYNKNLYLFQSKNPARFLDFTGHFPQHTILGTTIESNIDWSISKAPKQEARAEAMALLAGQGYHTMVTIEPIMDFTLPEMVKLVAKCRPAWINIGADSKGNDLPEPDRSKIELLVDGLTELGFTVLKKPNLDRLYRTNKNGRKNKGVIYELLYTYMGNFKKGSHIS